MKKYIFHLLVFAIYLMQAGCSDVFDDDLPSSGPFNSGSNNVGVSQSIYVKEKTTNLPLPGVTIKVYYCQQADPVFGGCLRTSQYSSAITDSNGIGRCIFPGRSQGGVELNKSMYWSGIFDYSYNEGVLMPYAWVNLSLKTNEAYPSTSSFVFRIQGDVKVETESFQKPLNDSLAVFTIFGNVENEIKWALYKTSYGEVVKSGTIILKPNKFEKLDYTLNY